MYVMVRCRHGSTSVAMPLTPLFPFFRIGILSVSQLPATTVASLTLSRMRGIAGIALTVLLEA